MCDQHGTMNAMGTGAVAIPKGGNRFIVSRPK
jgi:hypothetical protein